MSGLNYQEKKEKRQVASRSILDAFWSWVEETSAIPTTNELNVYEYLNYLLRVMPDTDFHNQHC